MNQAKIFITMLIVSPLTAHAYVDPSSSLLIIQGVLALFGAIMVFVKKPIQTIKGWWEKLRKPKDDA